MTYCYGFKNCKFHDCRVRGSCPEAWPYESYSEYVLSSTLSIYSTFITIMLRDYDAALLYHCWFLFILWWGCWYTNEPFWQEVGVKSLILGWPVRPVGLLLDERIQFCSNQRSCHIKGVKCKYMQHTRYWQLFKKNLASITTSDKNHFSFQFWYLKLDSS